MRQWVGGFTTAQGFDLLLLTVDSDGHAILDRPPHFRFQIPLDSLGDPASHARFATTGLVFDRGSDDGMLCTAEGETGGGHTCHLRPVVALDSPVARRLVGHYRLADSRTIMVSQDLRPEGRLLFYVDGEAVVRLYPIGSTRCLSERGEVIAFAAAGSDAAPALLAQRRADHLEVEVVVPAGEHRLAGTLLLPPGDGPHPTVILLHHANTHARDYYRLFAEAFVRHGLAAFIYDKRGWGKSTGQPLTSDIFDLADDAETVYRFLQAHPAVRSDAIGLWGISNGAWVAPLVASRVGDVAFVIGASLAGVTPARQEQVRRVNVAREMGVSPRALALLDRLWASLFDFYVRGEWTAEVERLLSEVNADEELQRLPKYPGHAPGLQPVPPLVPLAEIKAEGGAWVDGGFDPAPVYAGLHCPVLCVWGADDEVIPLEESVRRIRDALEASRHSRYDLRVLPDATHHLYVTSPQPTGIPAGEMHTRLHHVRLAPGVRDLMAEWAVAHSPR